MVFPRQVIKVQFLGDCYNQAEEWSTGFYMSTLSGTPVLPGNWAQLVAAHWQTFFTNATTTVSSRYRTVSVKTNAIDAFGHQITEPTQEYFYPTPISGAFNGTPMPPQISLVASLRTDVPRGDATHGRMYLPGIAATLDNDARVSSTAQTAVGTNLKTMIEAINGQTGGQGLRVVLASAKGLGTIRQVNKVMIGNLYDTQRRRRNGLTEAYSSQPVSTAGGSF